MKTALFDDGDDAFKEPLAPVFEELFVTQNEVPSFDEHGNPQTVIESAQRQDLTEDITKKLDVLTWPQVKFWKSRFVANDGTVSPPKFRVQKITRSTGEIVYALWTPVPAPIHEDAIAAIAAAAANGIPVLGWNITYHAWDGHWCTCTKALYENTAVGLFHPDCGRLREHRNNDGSIPNIGAMADDEYNGFYPTIRGTDAAHWDPTKKGMDAWRGGDVLYGQADEQGVRHPALGREVSGGRAEYREATKGYYHFDEGYFRDVEKNKQHLQDKRDAQYELDQEWVDKKFPRKLGEV